MKNKTWISISVGIIAAVLALGWLFPDGFETKADFRAKREMKQYVAYYECEYSIRGYYDRYDGTGVLRMYRDEDGYWADRLFTDDGYVVLDLCMEEFNLNYEQVTKDLNENFYVEIDIGEGPLNVNLFDLCREGLLLRDEETTEKDFNWCDYCGEDIPEGYEYNEDGETICPSCVYGSYRELLSDEVGKCIKCNVYYYISESRGLGMCVECDEHNSTDCNNCGENTLVRGELYDGFTLCDSCLDVLFSYNHMKDILGETETRKS